MDAEVQKGLQRILKKQGLDFVMGAAVSSVDAKKTKATVHYKLRKDDSEHTDFLGTDTQNPEERQQQTIQKKPSEKPAEMTIAAPTPSELK